MLMTIVHVCFALYSSILHIQRFLGLLFSLVQTVLIAMLTLETPVLPNNSEMNLKKIKRECFIFPKSSRRADSILHHKTSYGKLVTWKTSRKDSSYLPVLCEALYECIVLFCFSNIIKLPLKYHLYKVYKKYVNKLLKRFLMSWEMLTLIPKTLKSFIVTLIFLQYSY